MTYYLLFILYLFYTNEMMLDKKQIWAIFLFKFKLGYKSVEPDTRQRSLATPAL